MKTKKIKLTLLSKILLIVLFIIILLVIENGITKDIDKCIKEGNNPNYCYKQLHG